MNAPVSPPPVHGAGRRGLPDPQGRRGRRRRDGRRHRGACGQRRRAGGAARHRAGRRRQGRGAHDARRPGALHAPRARRGWCRPGDLDGGGLALLADCDWIVEAIVERPDAKRDLYARLEDVRKPGSIVSSNTSTIPLAALTQGLGEGFARDFLVTHFFNPPRYMRLLELVQGPATRADAVDAIAAFGDRRLGKTIVHCKDTPGFIANRIGGLWMQSAINHAVGPPPDGGGGGRGDGPADGRAQDRRVRPARPGRPRPDAARRRLHEGGAARRRTPTCRGCASTR